MENPPISLVIPTYNRKALLSELLAAANSQTVQYEEIIVVDDGSTDGTEAFLNEGFPNITYIRTPNRGPQNARNVGLKHATTEWVTLCDSDDLLDPGYNKHVSDFLAKVSEVDLVYSNFCFFNNEFVQADVHSRLPGTFFDGATELNDFMIKIPDLLDKILINQFLWPSGMTIRKSSLELVGYYDTNLRCVRSEDLEFTLRAISKLNVAVSKLPLVKIRKHGNNMSADSINQTMGEITILEKFIANTFFGHLKKYRVKQSIASRKEKLIIGLYDRQRFEELAAVYREESRFKWSLKSRLKYLVSIVPFPVIREGLWSMTKRVS